MLGCDSMTVVIAMHDGDDGDDSAAPMFMERGVYEVVSLSSMGRGSKLIGIRWVETNKGVLGKPKVRSRLVCQYFARGHTPDNNIAPTLPLAATRWLLSELASRGRRGPGDQR